MSEDFWSLKVAYEAQQAGGGTWGRCWLRGLGGRKVFACESSDAALNRLSTWLEVLIQLSLLDHHYIDSGAQSAGMPTEAHWLRDCLEEKSCCAKERSDIKKKKCRVHHMAGSSIFKSSTESLNGNAFSYLAAAWALNICSDTKLSIWNVQGLKVET